MRHQLIFISQPGEVEADHFVRPQRWFLSCPQRDQHAGYDRTVRLDLDSVLILADQVTTAKNLLEKAEEDLDRPAF